MLSRLPAPVRSLACSHGRRCSSTKAADPLKILFCGSDEFSIASLRALNTAKHNSPKLIRSIDVVHRPGKPAGRGLKTIREVPIKQIATRELNLDTHEIDTFTGWTPPIAIDLVVAVSFGLLVPPRILNAAKYGGLNVHPSLLPDLRGPAPIHQTLLKQRSKTGITIQTLHPKHFDRGMILAQTPAPGLHVPARATPSDLISSLGEIGGEMLVDVLKSRAFVPPLQDSGWYNESHGPIAHAEKVTKQHRHVDFATATAHDILTRYRVLGNLWSALPSGERVVLDEITSLGVVDSTDRKPGLCILDGLDVVAIRTVDGQVLEVKSSTVAGGKKGRGNAQVMRILACLGAESNQGHEATASEHRHRQRT